MDNRRVLKNRLSALKDCEPWEMWSWGDFIESIGIDRSSNWEDTVDRVCRLIGGDPEREAAADWVEAQGGLDEMQERMGLFADMLNRIDSIVCGDEQHCFDERIDLREADELFGVICDALGKRLMPLGMEWPRFDDGEKVCFGDSVPIYRRSGEVSESEVCSMAFRSRQTDIGTCADFRICLNGGERVKRPEPEVLAADGEPIREGETAYSIHDGKRATVKSLFGNIGLQMESDDGDRFETAPLNLTHKRPVLGADGLPIKVGETVWYDGAEYVVDRVYTASDGDYSVDLEFGDLRSATNVWPQLIDHTLPDTQERIDDDATMPPRAYYAKHIGHDVGLKDDAECTEAMVRHLLNRQRELDKRMIGGE